MATLNVFRNDAVGLLGRMTLKVDGRTVARLRGGQTASIDLAAGRHEVRAHMSWQASEPVTVHLADGDEVAVEMWTPEFSGTVGNTFWRARRALGLKVGS
ncbi:hypothetical protein [Plantactinospora soyae]|uniref:Uncharacterized protein n=1 Tax=Plantactinospora soyae TaxID=1544732 RepID=A0A927R7Y3_9ACTN|nr:hypothetical protein [Plantactinospora soyae]MBE1488311.1 hypothetical protein [Plantactinospora soyae]